MTGIQALERIVPGLPMKPGKGLCSYLLAWTSR